MGFTTGNVLEPACGVGNFFGLLPESMAGSKLYGVELDSITGRIARQLYQNANIAVQGYEDANLPDSFFDLAVGNVPFGNYGIVDKRCDKNNLPYQLTPMRTVQAYRSASCFSSYSRRISVAV